MNLEEALRKIKKATGLNQEQIAEKLGYTRSYLSDAITKGSSQKLINAISQEFGVVIEKELPVIIGSQAEEIEALKTAMNVMVLELAELKGRVTKKPFSDVLAALQRKMKSENKLAMAELKNKS